MSKVNEARDADKARLRSRYNAAVTRLADIEANAGTYTLAQARAAISDLAQVQGDVLKILKKLVEREV